MSFSNALVIMTSNIGSSHVGGGAAQVGFALPGSSGDAEEHAHSAVRDKVLEELKVGLDLIFQHCSCAKTSMHPHHPA